MNDRTNEPEDGVGGAEGIYGDTSADLPVVEEDRYGDTDSAVTVQRTELDEGDTHTTADVQGTDTAEAELQVPAAAPVWRPTQAAETEGAEATGHDEEYSLVLDSQKETKPEPEPSDYHVRLDSEKTEDPASANVLAEGAGLPAKDRESTPAAVTESVERTQVSKLAAELPTETATETTAETGSLPEVETTMVTRRSLLGGATSTIPAAAMGGAQGSVAADATAVDLNTPAAPTEDAYTGTSRTASAIPEAEQTTIAPALTNTASATVDVPTRSARHADADLFEGAQVATEMPGRGMAHFWCLLLGLIGTPIAWYLTMGGLASMGAIGKPIDWAGVTTLVAGLVLTAIILNSLRWSTLGVLLGSIELLVAAVPFYVRVQAIQDVYQDLLATMKTWGGIGASLHNTTAWSVNYGIFLIAGVAALFVVLGAHGARKNGRQREELRQSIATYKAVTA